MKSLINNIPPFRKGVEITDAILFGTQNPSTCAPYNTYIRRLRANLHANITQHIIFPFVRPKVVRT